MSVSPSYAVITPVRNEALNLGRVASALDAQTLQPRAWVLVDNGSTDETPKTTSELASRFAWVYAIEGDTRADRERGAPIVRAFHAGLAALPDEPDVVVKLDADITFASTHFERLLEAFAADPLLGIASGTAFELNADGVWRQRYGTGPGVWGACRGYRTGCLRQVLPLEERMGWDTIDLVKAELRGWHTLVLDNLPFFHHRPEGEREGRRARAWAIQGRLAYYLGYRPSYLVFRTLYRSLREPSAVGLLWGYGSSVMRRERPVADREIRAYVKRQQRLRQLPQRFGEALGRRDG